MKQRLDHKTQGRESAGWAFALVAFALAIHGVSEAMHAAEAPGASEFRKTIRPILETYCFDCHADGTGIRHGTKGGVRTCGKDGALTLCKPVNRSQGRGGALVPPSVQ